MLQLNYHYHLEILKFVIERSKEIICVKPFTENENQLIKALKLANDKKVNIPSYKINPGDEISISEKAQSQNRIQQALDFSKNREECEWIDVNTSSFSGTFKNVPDRASLDTDINENLIIELYSK